MGAAFFFSQFPFPSVAGEAALARSASAAER